MNADGLDQLDVVKYVPTAAIEKDRWPGKSLTHLVTEAINGLCHQGADIKQMRITVRPALSGEPASAGLVIRASAPKMEKNR